MFENDTLNLIEAIFVLIGIVASLSLLVIVVSWPFYILSNMDAGQDDIIDALDEIKAKLSEEKPCEI